MTQLFGFSGIAGKVNISAPELARLSAKTGGPESEPTIRSYWLKKSYRRLFKMTKQKQVLDMTQLFGFSGIAGKVNISTPELATRLGAKVGSEPTNPLDKTQLLGFETITTKVNFRDSSVASQVGAKIGGSEVASYTI